MYLQFLLSSYSGICSLLEPAVSVATKADVATTLVHLTQHSRKATTLIADIVVKEITKNGERSLDVGIYLDIKITKSGERCRR